MKSWVLKECTPNRFDWEENLWPSSILKRADGSVVPVEIRARSLPYDGRTVRVSAIRDVSERVQAEERQRHLENDLRHAAEQWRQTFDALDLGIGIQVHP